jgi:hypothetical protein
MARIARRPPSDPRTKRERLQGPQNVLVWRRTNPLLVLVPALLGLIHTIEGYVHQLILVYTSLRPSNRIFCKNNPTTEAVY